MTSKPPTIKSGTFRAQSQLATLLSSAPPRHLSTSVASRPLADPFAASTLEWLDQGAPKRLSATEKRHQDFAQAKRLAHLKSQADQVAEVRALERHVAPSPSGTGFAALNQMKASRLYRHTTAREMFQENVSQLGDDLETRLYAVVAEFRTRLDANSQEVSNQLDLLVESPDAISECAHVARQMDKAVETREQWISELENTLSNTEKERSTAIQTLFDQLVEELVDIGHLPTRQDILEDLYEDKTAIEAALVANAEGRADLCARLRIAQLKLAQEWSSRFQEGEIIWRKATFQRVLDQGYQTLIESDLVQPPDPSPLISVVSAFSTTTYPSHLKKLPGVLTLDQAKEWQAKGKELCEQVGSEITHAILSLVACAEEKEKAAQEMADAVRSKATRVWDSVDSSPSPRTDPFDAVLSAISTARSQGTSSLETWARTQVKDCEYALDKLSDQVIGIATVWSDQSTNVQHAQNTLESDLSLLQSTFVEQHKAREQALVSSISALERAGSASAVHSAWDHTRSILEEMRASHRSYFDQTTGLLEAWPVTLQRLLLDWRVELASVLGVKDPNLAPPTPHTPPAASPRPVGGKAKGGKPKGAKVKASPRTSKKQARPASTPPPTPRVLVVGDTTWHILQEMTAPEDRASTPTPLDSSMDDSVVSKVDSPVGESTPPKKKKGKRGKREKGEKGEKKGGEEKKMSDKTVSEPSPASEPLFEWQLPSPLPFDQVIQSLVIVDQLQALRTHALTRLVETESARMVDAHQTVRQGRGKGVEVLDAALKELEPRAGRIETQVYHVRAAQIEQHHTRLERHIKHVNEVRLPKHERHLDSLLKDLSKWVKDHLLVLVQEQQVVFKSTEQLDVAHRRVSKAHDAFLTAFQDRMEQVRQAATSVAVDVSSANMTLRKTWKSFDQGGTFDESELATYADRMSQVDEVVTAFCDKAAARVASHIQSLNDQLVASYDEYQRWFESQRASLEGLDRKKVALATLNGRIKGEQKAHETAADHLDALLERLESLCERSQGDQKVRGDANRHLNPPTIKLDRRGPKRIPGQLAGMVLARQDEVNRWPEEDACPPFEGILAVVRRLRIALIERAVSLQVLEKQTVLDHVSAAERSAEKKRKRGAVKAKEEKKEKRGKAKAAKGKPAESNPSEIADHGDAAQVISILQVATLLCERTKTEDGVDDPPAFQAVQENMQVFRGAACTRFREQVKRASEDLERAVRAAFHALLLRQFELRDAARHELETDFQSALEARQARKKVQRLALHPRFAHPSNRQELEDMDAAERHGTEQAIAFAHALTQNVIALENKCATDTVVALDHLIRNLLQLLDGCIQPTDLLVLVDHEVARKHRSIKHLLAEDAKKQRARDRGGGGEKGLGSAARPRHAGPRGSREGRG